jgi:hypothetical protein
LITAGILVVVLLDVNPLASYSTKCTLREAEESRTDEAV